MLSRTVQNHFSIFLLTISFALTLFPVFYQNLDCVLAITTQEENKGVTSHVATKEDRYTDPTNGNTVHVTTQAAKFDKDAPVKGG